MYKYICFVCDKEVRDNEEFEWFGYDGEKIHKACKPNLNKAYDFINNMNNEEFNNWMKGGLYG